MTEGDGILTRQSQNGTQWKKKLRKKPQKVPKIALATMINMKRCLINIDQNRRGKRKQRRKGNALPAQAAAVIATAPPPRNSLEH